MTGEEAIEVLKHTEKNIKYDGDRKEIYFTDKWVQAYEMAIAVLREQEEWSKGCIHCSQESDIPLPTDMGFTWISGNELQNSYGECVIKFCPMCGRKLEVEG